MIQHCIDLVGGTTAPVVFTWTVESDPSHGLRLSSPLTVLRLLSWQNQPSRVRLDAKGNFQANDGNAPLRRHEKNVNGNGPLGADYLRVQGSKPREGEKHRLAG
ncbi:hypothetical protein BgiMline_011589 [Biomphalaria glabrata]|nr:hypothetical protein BgiMline_029060 [Biomphalaria glabrata]